MCSGYIDECLGCIRDDGDIKNALRYCSHCKRGYSNEEERRIHEDFYKDIRETEVTKDE